MFLIVYFKNFPYYYHKYFVTHDVPKNALVKLYISYNYACRPTDSFLVRRSRCRNAAQILPNSPAPYKKKI